MYKRLMILLAVIFLAAIVISGCGSKNNNEENVPEVEIEEEEEVEVEENEPEERENEENNEEIEIEEDEANNETENEEENETVEGSEDFAAFITFMEESTEGTANVIYENNEPQIYELDDMSVSIDAYTLVELEDFHSNFAIPFNDQTEGGVIIAKYSVTNDRAEDAYYAPHFYINYTGATKAFGPTSYLIPEEEEIAQKLSHTNNYLIKAGETVTGYTAYGFGQDHFEEALELSTVAVEIPSGQEKEDSFADPIGKSGHMTLSLNEDGEAKTEGNKAFYNDKVTGQDMGDKQMVKEIAGIDESQDLRDVKVTLDGYQFTDFTPNEVEAQRFSSFKEGVILLTVKFNLDNQGEDNIGLSALSSRLFVNDGAATSRNEGLLLDYNNHDVIKVGESGDLLQIYVLDKEQYEKIWKDKEFEIEIGPMQDEEAKDISKGHKIMFTLPE